MSGPPPEELARRLAGVDAGYGRAGASALNALGLSSQMPREDCWAIRRRPPAHVPPGMRFVSRLSRLARVVHQLNPVEVAVLEALDASNRHWIEVEVNDVDDRIRNLAAIGEVDRNRLLAGAANEPHNVRARLHDILA